MNILGEGEARGGVSILHALGTGKGCSVGVNLLTKVKLADKKSENLQDKHKLLDSVIKCWKAEGFPLPKEYGWDISSEVPIGQGLKSSSALACAAIKSLDSASWMNLNNFEIIDLAVKNMKLAVHGWESESEHTIEDYLKILEDNDIAEIVYTDVDKDGMLNGMNFDELNKLLKITNIPIIASGGVTSIEDIKNLSEICKHGISGVIIGKALYENRINLSDVFNIIGD